MKGHFGPKFAPATEQTIGRFTSTEEGEIEDDDDYIGAHLVRSLKNYNKIACKPGFGKLSRVSTTDGSSSNTAMRLNAGGALTLQQTLQRLIEEFNRERYSHSISWGNGSPAKVNQLETGFINAHKHAIKAAEDGFVGNRYSDLFASKMQLETEKRDLDSHCSGLVYYTRLIECMEALLSQERFTHKIVSEANFEAIEKQLQSKLEHKYNYLEKLSCNIEVSGRLTTRQRRSGNQSGQTHAKTPIPRHEYTQPTKLKRLSSMSRLSRGVSQESKFMGGNGFEKRVNSIRGFGSGPVNNTKSGPGLGDNSGSHKFTNLSAGNGRNSNSVYSVEEQQEFYQLAIGLRMQLDISNPAKKIPVSFLLKKAEDMQVPRELWSNFIKKELRIPDSRSIFSG